MKNQKGITLIALVITIIVLLILAGITIAMLTGENGLLSKSQATVADSRIAATKDEVSTHVQAYMADFLQAKYSNTAWTANANNNDAQIYVLGKVNENKNTLKRECSISVNTSGSSDQIVVWHEGRKVLGTVANDGTLTWKAIENS